MLTKLFWIAEAQHRTVHQRIERLVVRSLRLSSSAMALLKARKIDSRPASDIA
jgi:hypothetical protein